MKAKKELNMWKQSVARALIAGVVYVALMWTGDEFLFDTPHSWGVYLIEFLIFTAIMAAVYYFFSRRDEKRKERE